MALRRPRLGVASYPEWALPGLTAEQVQRVDRPLLHQGERGPLGGRRGLPDGLRLDLPEGSRQPAPSAVSVLPATPAWFPDDGGRSAGTPWCDGTPAPPSSPPSWNAGYGTQGPHRIRTPSRRHRPDPRHRGGRPRGPEAALGALVDVLAAMRAGRIEPDEIATVVELTCEGLRDAEARGARLPGQAFNLLAGRDVQSLNEAVAEVRAVTAADVAEVAAAA